MKAMRKVVRGAGFRGALDYVFNRSPEDRAAGVPPGKLLGGNMLGADPRSLAAEFKIARQARPDIERPVWHQSLRLPVGEKIDEALWVAISSEYMERMGFSEDHQYVVVQHDDAGGQHVHIVASRVSTTGEVWKGRDENLITTKLVAELEKKYNLNITATARLDEKTGLPSATASKRKLKKGEVEKAIRTGLKPPRLHIQEFLDRALSECEKTPGKYSLDDLARACARNGITLKPFVDAASGEVRGVSFECEGQVFSGSQLGENYKFRSLTERLKHGNNHKTTESLSTAERVRNDVAGKKFGEQDRKDGASDRPAATRSPTNPVQRAAGQTERSTEMINPFKRKPAAPVAPIAPVINSIGVPTAGPLARPSAPPPPSLGGKLIPIRKSDGTFDLMFRESDRPTFNWSGEPHRVQLLGQQSPKNISTLFDLAAEKGIGMPMIQITGQPEFQVLAAMEAAKRGIPIDTAKLCDQARDAYRAALDSQPLDNCISATTSAYESEDRHLAEQARLREKDREADRERERDRMKLG
jgi:hypothetical protein